MGHGGTGKIQEHGELSFHVSGQETFAEYRYVKAPMYYRGANAALLLYDITNSSTFDDVRGWLEGE